MTAVGNKISDISGLEKTNKQTNKQKKQQTITQKLVKLKIKLVIIIKYITTPKFNIIAARVFNERLVGANLETKTDFDTEFKKISDSVTSNKTKHFLVEHELKKLKTFYLSYFRGKSHFEEDGTQNHLIFQPMYKYFKITIDNISERKSKELSDESMKTPSTSNNFLNPLLDYVSTKIGVKFSGSCLKQDKSTHNHGTIVNIYIVYEISNN